jgi:Fe-S-cluster-containing hydrogenase component 2
LAKEKARIKANWERCRGCQLCQLICSFVHEKVFNPTKAAILIERLAGDTEFGVTFSPRCVRCGSCIQYCLYGALSRETETQDLRAEK